VGNFVIYFKSVKARRRTEANASFASTVGPFISFSASANINTISVYLIRGKPTPVFATSFSAPHIYTVEVKKTKNNARKIWITT
jgi:hypothetical protein